MDLDDNMDANVTDDSSSIARDTTPAVTVKLESNEPTEPTDTTTSDQPAISNPNPGVASNPAPTTNPATTFTTTTTFNPAATSTSSSAITALANDSLNDGTSSSSNKTNSKTIPNILEAMGDFDSSIPDAVVQHFLEVAGMQTSDPRIVKLIAVAAQKFVHDIVSDSLQHCKLRGAQGKKTKEKKFTLTIEDLSSALGEYGIEVKRQQYFN